jgi:hypothetical protein
MKILNARQVVKRNMYDVVITKCDANPEITGRNTALTAALSELKTLLASITAAAPLSAAVITGITTDKKVSKDELSQTAAILAGQIYAYAAKTRNNTLKEAANFSVSDLKRLKDGELGPRCQAIYDLGAENLSALKDYGVSSNTLTDLQEAIEAYTQTVPKPRSALADRSTVKANLRQYFKETDALLLEQIDKLVESFAEEFPDFVATYKSARIIVDEKTKPKPNGANGAGSGTMPG